MLAGQEVLSSGKTEMSLAEGASIKLAELPREQLPSLLQIARPFLT